MSQSPVNLDGLDESALRAVAAQAARLLRHSDTDAINAVPHMDDAALEHLVRYIEDRDAVCGNGGYDPSHYESGCPACVARTELSRRAYRRESLLPGENSATYIPGVQTVSCFHDDARDMQVGDVVRHRPFPGTDRVVHVEAVEVSVSEIEVLIAWRTTNTTDAPFVVTYNPDDSLDRYRISPITPRSTP